MSNMSHSSINIINCNSKSLNKEFLQFNPLINNVLQIKLPRNSIYKHFELNSTRKVWIKWNFELTVFDLTIQFNIEKIGKFHRFWKKFELGGTSN